MPASFEIDPTRRLVLSRAWGELSDADLAAHYADIGADPLFDPSFRQFADLREVTTVAISTPALIAAAHRRVFTPGVRRAFVASVDHHFGMARMFELYAEAGGQAVRVFRDVDAALEWLELS